MRIGVKRNSYIAMPHLPDGIAGVMPHNASDLMTKVTAVSPDNNGNEIWMNALNKFFCNDIELIQYVQMIVGLAAIGKVYVEALIITYGESRNGKSTFWNTIAKSWEHTAVTYPLTHLPLDVVEM